jgi:phage internal scaffolding protein
MARDGKMPLVRDPYTPYEDPGLDCSLDEDAPEGLTDQSQADDCDVNRIVDRFMKTGVLPGVDVERVYGDFSSPTDFHEAMNVVARGMEQFESLDAKIRKRFNNDPGKFLEFVHDPDNLDEMVRLGLASKPVEEAPKGDTPKGGPKMQGKGNSGPAKGKGKAPDSVLPPEEPEDA